MGNRAKRSCALVVAFTILAPAATALAANETDVAPFLHFKGGLGWYGEVVNGQYTRDGSRIAGEKRVSTRVEAHFGVWKGLEAYLKTSYDTWDRLHWQDIGFEAAPGTPVTPNDQVEKRKGLTDVTLGAKYAILDEARGTGDVSTWTVETAVTFPGSFKIYPDTAPGATEAPAGNPGSALLLKTSFSKRVRRVDPYVSFFFLNRGTASAPSEGVGDFNLADEWGTFFGSEVVGFERPEQGLKFSADAGVGWTWVNPGEVPENRFLYGPDGDSANAPPGNVVHEQGYIRYDSRIGFFYQLQKNAQASGHFYFGLPSDHYIETYPASFADPQQGGKIRNHVFTDFGYEFALNGVF